MSVARLVLALAAPFLLASCLLSPGKFTSTLDIRKDRSFTFTYVGEVISAAPKVSGGDQGSFKTDPPIGETEAQRQAIAAALSKEEGYRSVRYLGGGHYAVDYAISGRLDHNFAYPLNLDAVAFIPWVAIELRKDGTARVMGLAFGDASKAVGPPGASDDSPVEGREGTFTLTTDAAIISQNGSAAPGAPTKLVWHVTPTSKTVPTLVVRF